MQTATLLYNPAAGKGRAHRTRLHAVTTALESKGYRCLLTATEGPGSAGEQAQLAALRSDIIFACGGDGTIFETIQGLANSPSVPLGIIPLGSANVLARHLELSLDPVQAALQQTSRRSVCISLGQVTYTTRSGEASRYFISLAGAGADGMLTYRMLAAGKHRLGRSAYYLRACAMLASKRFPPFPIAVQREDGAISTAEAVSAMVVRVGDLGGLFRPLVRPATLDHAHLALTTIAPPSRLSLPAWFALSWTRLSQRNPLQQDLHVSHFHCGPGRDAAVQVQADGEWLGRTPMSVRLVPSALHLFPPTSTSPQVR